VLRPDAGPPPVPFHGCDDPRSWEPPPDERLRPGVIAEGPCRVVSSPLADFTLRFMREDGRPLSRGPVCARVIEGTEGSGFAAGDVFGGEDLPWSLRLLLPSGHALRLEARAWIEGRVGHSEPFTVRHDRPARLRALPERPIAMLPGFGDRAEEMQPWLLFADRIEGPDGPVETEGAPLDLTYPNDRGGLLVLETSEAEGLRVRDPLRDEVWPVGPHDPDARFVPGDGPAAVVTGGWVHFARSDSREPVELPPGAENLAMDRGGIALTVDGTIEALGELWFELVPRHGVDRLAPAMFEGFIGLAGDRIVYPRGEPDDPGLPLPEGVRDAIGPVRGLFADYGPMVVGERGLAVVEPEEPTAGLRLVTTHAVLGGRVVDFSYGHGSAVLVVEADDGALSLHAMLSHPIGCI